MRGRVMGIMSICNGTLPLGILVYGALAEVLGGPLVLGAGNSLAVFLVLVVMVAQPRLWQMRRD
jgi:hypothetical protein